MSVTNSEQIKDLIYNKILTNVLNFRKSQLQNEVQLRDSWALLDGGKCFNKILRFGPSDPFHYEIVTICSLPDIHIFMHPSLRGIHNNLHFRSVSFHNFVIYGQ